MDTQQEDAERYEFQRRVPDYIALHESVSSSTALLDSLASFLSTFQHDLASVAGEIGELQVHSTDIEGRSKGRKSLAKPLDALIGEIILSPQLITTIRDTRPGDAWLGAVKELDDKIRAVKARGEVRAAHDVGMVVEGLKQKAIASLRQFLLNMLKPIRASVKTNIHIIQSSILLKYLPFFHFLKRQAPKIAQEVQRAYVVSARAYYETCFRRYARSMSQIAARSPEYASPIGTPSAAEIAAQTLLLNRTSANRGGTQGGSTTATGTEQFSAADRLRYAKLIQDDVKVVPGYAADDKAYKQPVEALFRSLSLVLMDNASAEYTFIVRYFSPPSDIAPSGLSSRLTSRAISPAQADSATHTRAKFERKDSTLSTLSANPSSEGNRSPLAAPSPRLRPDDSISEVGDDSTIGRRSFADSPVVRPASTSAHAARQGSFVSIRNGSVVVGGSPNAPSHGGDLSRETRREMEAIWHQVFDPALEYCETFFRSVVEPIAPPPTIPLLSMIRLNDAVIAELEDRGCTPLESTMLGLKLVMWPLFQKEMDSHVESLKRMADAAGSSGFSAMLKGAAPKESVVREVAIRYAQLVSRIAALSQESEEAMLANSLGRLRKEIFRLITQQSAKLKTAPDRESFVSTICEEIIRELGNGPADLNQPRLQSEIGFFRVKEEEARQKMRI